MAIHDEETDLRDVRRAALVLRERDPSEAVRILRQIVRRGTDAAVLAHGALGEILLDDFDDLDGAAHHFRALLEKAPGIPAGELGLARTLARQGQTIWAGEAYGRALTGLATTVRGALAPPPEEESAPEAIDECVLSLLEIIIEHGELGLAPGTAGSALPDVADCFAWAEQVRLFDDADEPAFLGDWERYADMRAIVLGLAGDAPALEGFLGTFTQLASIPTPALEHARSLGREALGDFEGAARLAVAALAHGALDEAPPPSVLRAADLLRVAGQMEASAELLGRLRVLAASHGADGVDLVAAIDARLGSERPPSLVRLGVRRA